MQTGRPAVTQSRHRRWGAPTALLLAALLWLLGGAAALARVADASATVDSDAVLVVFVREGCPHCASAERFLETWQRAHPAPRVLYRQVDRDPAARAELIELSQRAGVWPPGVPTFVYGGRLLVGFGEATRFETELKDLLGGAQDPPEAGAPAPVAAPPAAVDAGWLGTLELGDLGLPLFTLAVGLVDGFNPCAMWVLLFLLSLLVRLRDRRRMALIATTFVVASGAVYYAFMAAWLNLFLAVGFSQAVRVGLALLALGIAAVNIGDFLRGSNGFTLSIPDAAKPAIYTRARRIVQTHSMRFALTGVVALAIAVNFVELLCTAGLPALYTAVLTQQGLDAPARYGYLLLYIAGYVLDDAIMVATAVAALGTRRLTEAGGRWLKLLSGAVMLGLALVMLLRPAWLQ